MGCRRRRGRRAVSEPLLSLEKISAGYGQANVVRDIELEVLPGEIVTLLGPNGAGKTTTLRAISG
ncbi:MAG: ATP-binding cassette domain-containing protein, partial [Acidimicrobiales bacterium]